MSVARPAEVTSPVCHDCPSRCCTKMFGWTQVELLAKEAKRVPFKGVAVYDTFYEYWLLKFTKEGCPFLVDNACSIYADRPKVCRQFICHSMPRLLRRTNDFKDYPKHRKLLNKWAVLPGQPDGISIRERNEK